MREVSIPVNCCVKTGGDVTGNESWIRARWEVEIGLSPNNHSSIQQISTITELPTATTNWYIGRVS